MEKWRVIGVRPVDFKDKDKSITGYSLYICRPGGPGMEGDEAQKIFISDQKVSYVPALGDQIQIVYNRYGKVADVVLCQ